MVSVNRAAAKAPGGHVTHEGAPARRIGAEAELRRSVMACMLWEREFYESGEDIAARIGKLTAAVPLPIAAQIAVEARERMHLRHAPLLIANEMSKRGGKIVGDTLAQVIQRADELTEFLALYWKDGRRPLAKQVKRGLALAFPKFNAYQLAKYNRDGAVKLRDALFLCHAKPKDAEQDAIWKKLIDGALEAPDTWEVALSAGADKKATWERLIAEKKLGGLALLRNLRNMQAAKVNDDAVRAAIRETPMDRVLPFRFISAAKYAPTLEPELEAAMFGALASAPKLPGKTILLIDVSGSMVGEPISAKSEIDRLDAACGLAMLLREVCDDPRLYAFSCPGPGRAAPPGALTGTITAQNRWGQSIPNYPAYCMPLPPRRGFALRDVIKALPNDGTPLGWAITTASEHTGAHDRLIVLTDEQSHDPVPNPKCERGYMVNVASAKRGVGYGHWTHVDGWSEAIVEYIRELERGIGETMRV